MAISQRRLPHIYAIGQPLFVTFRLHGSLPAGREFPIESLTSGRAFVAMDRLLDTARFGPIHLKGYSARQVNQSLGRTGHPFWQDESYDRLVRNGEEFRRIESYILTNPVKAGWAQSVEAFLWSSAARGGSADPPQV